VTALVAPVFIAACAVPDGGLFRAERFRDVHVYGVYADAFLRGEIPYRDFFVEYPPGAFVVFLPPAVLDAGSYNFAFKTLMAICGLAALFAGVSSLLALRADRRWIYLAAALFALSPLAVGPISLNTYDLWPALLTVGALAALLAERERLAFGLLGLALTAKVYPIVLLPPALLYAWTAFGARRTRAAALVLVAVAVAVIVPFAVIAPEGLWDSVDAQASRSLQIESLGASVLFVADQVGIYDATVARGSTGAISRDLAGSLPDAFAVVTSLLQLVAVAAVWLLFWRGRRDGRRLALAFAAAVAGFLAFNRFISPQYVVWLIPLVLVVPRRLAAALLAAALVLAQLWFFHYRDVFALDDIVWLLVARNLMLVALLGVLLAALWPREPLKARA
jgi:uncharacterized membrane protein